MSKFQIILMTVFGLAIIAGLAVFSLASNNGRKAQTVHMWGTLDSSKMFPVLEKINQATEGKLRIIYTQKPQAGFDDMLVEAIAVRQGPDLILIAQDQILQNYNKILPIDYKTYPERTFKESFIQEGELFLTANSVLALPFAVDPMVMYWNRDIFSNAQVSTPPKYWEEFLPLAEKLTIHDENLTITQSMVAFGEYRNVTHAKDIISMLVLQGGNPIVVTRTGRSYDSTFSQSFGNLVPAADSALTYYTQFADPLKQVYSWNRAMPESKVYFLSNKLGLYFGYASEYAELREKNSNLNFDVATVPQPKPQNGSQAVSITFGKIYGVAMLKSSPKAAAALEAAKTLTSAANIAQFAKTSGMPSVRRDALRYDPSKSEASVFTTSALWSRGWLDPGREKTDVIFRDTVDSITSGRLLKSEAILRANSRINDALNSVNKEF